MKVDLEKESRLVNNDETCRCGPRKVPCLQHLNLQIPGHQPDHIDWDVCSSRFVQSDGFIANIKKTKGYIPPHFSARMKVKFMAQLEAVRARPIPLKDQSHANARHAQLMQSMCTKVRETRARFDGETALRREPCHEPR